MNGEARREKLLKILKESDEPLSGSRLSKKFQVSRQIIVQDIALLKAAGHNILSTHRGYYIESPTFVTRIMKVFHGDDKIADEMNAIVDLGGTVVDVFVYHKLYGKIHADLNLSTPQAVADFVESITTGRSKPLANLTSGYHYHLIKAETDGILNKIETMLKEKGYLIQEES